MAIFGNSSVNPQVAPCQVCTLSLRPVALSGLNSRFDRKDPAHKARRLAPIAALAVILLGIVMPVLYVKFDA